jgi:hypothetical protein
MKKTIAILTLLIAGSTVGLSGCQTGSTLTLSFSQLEALDKGHYEGWAIFGDEKVSTGTFNIGDDLSFSVSRDLMEADMIVITIEPEGDSDKIPSGIVILAGELNGNSASLKFPVDFSGASGIYILATPTNGANSDEASGIWFLKVPPQVGLELPALPQGWTYEGWAVNGGMPLTSGKFTSADGADNFDDYSGPEAGPPFPGEDYLQNAPQGITFPINLADGASLAVISVEPDLNGMDPTGVGPFQVKPLVANIPSGAKDHTNYDMGQNLNSVPSGLANISK